MASHDLSVKGWTWKYRSSPCMFFLSMKQKQSQCCQPGIFNAFYGKIGIF